jgi:hypothetical protein
MPRRRRAPLPAIQCFLQALVFMTLSPSLNESTLRLCSDFTVLSRYLEHRKTNASPVTTR